MLNNKNRRGNINILYICVIISYLFYFIFYALNNPDTESIFGYTFIFRLLSIAVTVVFIVNFILIKYYNSKCFSLFVIFLFQLFFSIIYVYYYDSVGLIFGYDASDSIEYHLVVEQTKKQSVIELVRLLKTIPRLASISDWGYPIYRHVIAIIFPNEQIEIFMLAIINAIIQTLSSYYVYRIARFYFNYDYSNIIMVFWGFSSTSLYINTVGLKETIFALFVVQAFYFLLKFYYCRNLNNLLMFIVPTVCTLFFREFITLFLIVTLFCSCFLRRVFNKLFLLGIICFYCVAFFCLDIFVRIIPKLWVVALVREERLIQFFGSTGLFANLLNIFLAYCTPIPRYNNSAVAVHIVNQTFAVYKITLVPFVLFGIYKILRNKCLQLYPVLLMYTFNIVLIIVTCYSLDFRYVHITTFLDFLIAIYGFKNLMQNGVKVSKKRISPISIIIIFFIPILVLVILYNN